MRTCVLTANLNGFDRVHMPVEQSVPCDYHCFTDSDFPPIAGLSPRLQYRIPKTHGWQMKPGYDYYIWLDGSVTLMREDSVAWLVDQLGTNSMAFFAHPDRQTVRQEVEYLEKKKDHPYLKARYENGLHKEQFAEIEASGYPDGMLLASTVFIYRNTQGVQEMLKEWLYTSVRYFTCDQVALPYLIWKYSLGVKQIDLNPFDNPHTKLVSSHR